MASVHLRKVCTSATRKTVQGLQLSKVTKQHRTHPACLSLFARASSTDSNTTFRQETATASNMMDIGCRRIFSEEHDIFRQNARRFFREEVAPFHDEWEERGHVGKELWEKAGANGILGIDTPEEHGGLGADWLSCQVAIEEQSYVNCFGPGFVVHNHIVMPYISRFGTEAQRQKYIPDMTAGKTIGAIAMTEPAAGSDLQGMRTYAKQAKDDWILNGSKVFITNGYLAGLVIVAAVTNPSAKSPAHGMSLFLVEEGMPGFRKGQMIQKMGLKAQDTAELFFDDVRIPKENVLGEAHRGFYMLMKELPQERLMIGVSGAAHAEWMYEITREYVKQRKAFGKTLAHLQTIQHKLAEMKTEICITRSFVDSCCQIHNERGLDSQQASMAKYWATELENRVANQCVQMHGGWGYMWEYPIAKAYVNARPQTIYGGSNEIMKELIVRSIVAD